MFENERMKRINRKRINSYIMETKMRRDLTKDVFTHTDYRESDFKNHPHSDRAPHKQSPALSIRST